MKWYFASRTKNRELIRSVIKLLKDYDHEISYDWTVLEKLEPYSENAEKNKEIADKIPSAIRDADVFVLISDPSGTDMFVELGIAIYSWIKNRKPRIYIVGEYGKRSLMHFHPSIMHKDSLISVLKKECLEIPNKKLDLFLQKA